MVDLVFRSQGVQASQWGPECDSKGSMFFFAELVPVSAYVGSSENLKDLKWGDGHGVVAKCGGCRRHHFLRVMISRISGLLRTLIVEYVYTW